MLFLLVAPVTGGLLRADQAHNYRIPLRTLPGIAHALPHSRSNSGFQKNAQEVLGRIAGGSTGANKNASGVRDNFWMARDAR